ncbi:DUF3318 domain-containing protein [Trichocoleus desertorum AS-A10]|uniref:DUF3318 domain-containing protein n=1 Tax=Trichocoleus desertorum TaxID=1481672 RepID=UPI0032A107D0
MMNPDPEVRRLLDIMPASGRMLCRIVNKPEQSWVIDYSYPVPWSPNRPVFINFDLWSQLSRPQRDLTLLRAVSWLIGIKWFKPDLYRGLIAVGLVGAGVEAVQGDAVGLLMAGGLAAIAGTQIWRSTQSSRRELETDEAAIRVALRRGYTEAEAARHLLEAIEAVAQIEGRLQLSFTELVRCQNLRAIAGLSPVATPETLRQE